MNAVLSGPSGQDRADLRPPVDSVSPNPDDHDGGDPRTELYTAEQVGHVCGCSPAHVRRLADAGRMPAPVKVGVLVRWSRRAIESWIASGCPRAAKGGAR